jgi:hypothetical protein
MGIISFIEDPEIVKKILKHIGLWDLKARPPPKAMASLPNIRIDYVYFVEDVYFVDYVYFVEDVYFYKSRMDSQIPPSDDYLYVDVEYPEVISA